MTAEEYLNEKILKGNRDSLFLVNTILNLMQDFAQIKCKEIEKYYDTELEMLYEDDIISEKIFLQIKGNSPEPKF